MSSDTSLIFRLIAKDEASPTLNRMQEHLSTASAAIGASVAGALGVGVAQAMDMSAANAKLQTQLGVGPAEAARLAQVSAHVYQNAWGESTADVNEAIKGVYQQIGDVSQAEGGLEGVTTKVMALSDAFDQDLGGVTAAVGQMIKTGLAKNADEALDTITVGFQKGVDKAGDLLDTFNEYGVQFHSLGIDGKMAMGILSQGLKGGARDADLVADSLKEFNLRARDITSTAPAGFKALGLNAKQMAADIAAGGPRATAALQKTLDALRKYPESSKKASVAAALFGTQSEDMQKALNSIDPSKAVAGLGKVDGAAKKAVNTLGNSPASAMEAFKRTIEMNLAQAGGIIAQFAMRHTGALKPLAIALGVVAALVITVSAAQRVYATYTAIATAAETVRQSALYMSVAGYLRLMGVGLMAMARIAGAAVLSAATTAAAWVGSALVAIGTWIAAVVRASITAVAQFALMAARAVIWAATMAAQWLIAMGPIGWIIAAVIAFVAVIIANWGKVKSVTVAVWSSIVGWVAGVPGKISAFFARWGIGSVMSSAWSKANSGTVSVVTSIVNYVRGIPGMITKALGSLGSLLYNAGKSILQGLINGIKDMAGSVKNAVSSVLSSARDLLPFSPAKEGPFSGKGWTLYSGQSMMTGLAAGITSNRGAAREAMTTALSFVQASPLMPGQSAATAPLGSASRTTPMRPIQANLNVDGKTLASVLIDPLRGEILHISGGSVQKALGRGSA